ncbi:MAG: WG repeat-containing protein [Bacteroidota bacterium]
MAFRFAFMISLMLLLACADERAKPVFDNFELDEYNKILADFEPPKYKWGFLTEQGQLAIEDKYDDLREFNEGLAAMNVLGLWGYVDKSGTEVIPARYRIVKTFSEDIAVVQKLNKHFMLLSGDGKVLADSLDYLDVGKFHEGLSLVNQSYLFGFINKKGELTIKPTYESAKAFSNGLALVQKSGKYGFIDSQDSVVIPLQYDKIWYPQEGMIRFKKEGKYGFLDLKSKSEIMTGFASATDFHHQYAVINDGNNYSLLDKNGTKKILPYNFVDVGGEGKWMYAADDRFGFLNNDGSVLCLPQYDLLMRFQEGRAGFSINDTWGYLDETGSATIPAQYPLAWDFVNGYARIIGRYGFGFIDKSGKEVHSPKYMEVRDYSEGLARIQVYR